MLLVEDALLTCGGERPVGFAMELFDTHAHLDDEQFGETIDGVIQRARSCGVTRILAVGTTVVSSTACLELSNRFPGVFAAVGIHPNYCAQAAADDWGTIVELARANRVIALGETGLDGYWNHAPMITQQDYFDRHLRLSQETGLPFIVHMRDSMNEILIMLREARQRGPLSGVMHSFTGDLESARECLDLGLYISFAGMVTFKKSDALRTAAAEIPSDRILVETDSPYLSPEPKRGQRPNEPGNVVYTAECLARCRGVTTERFAQEVTENSRRLFTRAT
jgi:TatD DNase family protein